jgi:chromosome segregation ATPase
LKKRLSQLYEDIERLTEKYHQQKWNTESLKKLPQDSLEYYKKLSFLEDQARAIKINSSNYQERLKQIEQDLGQEAPKFFTEFEKDINFYTDQIKSNIGFLTPGIQLFEKLMLSVQTQVSIDDAAIQKQQNQRQAKLGQLLTGASAAIAIGQILYEPIKATVSQRIDRGQNQISIYSLWSSAGLTIIMSIFCGYLLSKLVYQWFTKEKF